MNSQLAQVGQRPLTESQEELLMLVNKKKRVAMDEVSDGMEGVKSLIDEGHLQLAAVVYSWGVEFEFTPTHGGALLVEAHQGYEAQ